MRLLVNFFRIPKSYSHFKCSCTYLQRCFSLLMMWDDLESLYDSIHFQKHWLGLVDLCWNMVPSLHLSMIISKSPLGMLHLTRGLDPPVRSWNPQRKCARCHPKVHVSRWRAPPKLSKLSGDWGWDLWMLNVGGADGSCQEKKHRFQWNFLATFNDLIHPESLKVKRFYRFSLENWQSLVGP